MRAGERGGAPARADLEHHEVAPVEELDEEVGLVVRGAGGSLHPGPVNERRFSATSQSRACAQRHDAMGRKLARRHLRPGAVFVRWARHRRPQGLGCQAQHCQKPTHRTPSSMVAPARPIGAAAGTHRARTRVPAGNDAAPGWILTGTAELYKLLACGGKVPAARHFQPLARPWSTQATRADSPRDGGWSQGSSPSFNSNHCPS